MDLLDLLQSGCLIVGVGVPALFVLATTLRVACHLCGATIPTLGRAMAAALLAEIAGSAVALIFQLDLLGPSTRVDTGTQVMLFLFSLPVQVLLAAVVYVLVLRLGVGRALRVGFVQLLILIPVVFILICSGRVLVG